MPEPRPLNKRQLIRECRERAQKRHRGPTPPSEPTVPAEMPLDDSYGNPAYKRLRIRRDLGSDVEHPKSQSRLVMMHAASPWTAEIDTMLRVTPIRETKQWTRHKEGGKSVGLRPWGRPFETVGGSYWYCNLLWDEGAWRHFARTVLGTWNLQHILEYFILRDPKGPMRCDEEEGEDGNGKKKTEEEVNNETARRLAYTFEHATTWDHTAPGVPIEISGDSLVVCNWLNGLYACTTDVYSETIAAMQNTLWAWSASIDVHLRAPRGAVI